jgi:hypothetical protein
VACGLLVSFGKEDKMSEWIKTMTASVYVWTDPRLPGVHFTAEPRGVHGWWLGGVVMRSESGVCGVVRIEGKDAFGNHEVIFVDFYRYTSDRLSVSGLEGTAHAVALDVISTLACRVLSESDERSKERRNEDENDQNNDEAHRVGGRRDD